VPWGFGRVIPLIRDHGVREITGQFMTAFVSFPSYHAASAVLFAWGAWPMKWLRWPSLVLNAALCASALIIGAHYLVDLLAGFAVACGAVFAATSVTGTPSLRSSDR
jgi:membrane-associated phospholipid phosphatase